MCELREGSSSEPPLLQGRPQKGGGTVVWKEEGARALRQQAEDSRTTTSELFLRDLLEAFQSSFSTKYVLYRLVLILHGLRLLSYFDVFIFLTIHRLLNLLAFCFF